MKKRQNVLVILVLSLLFAVGAEAKTVVRFIKWPGANYDAALDPDVTIVNEFNRLNPDIEVQMEIIDNYHEKLMVQLAGGMYPDVLKVDPTMIIEYSSFGLLEDLTPYVDSSLANSLWPIATMTSQIFGGLYAMPIEIQPNVLYFNVDAYARFGLTDPNLLYKQNNWHWGTFLEAAKKLTQDTTGDGEPDVYGYKGSTQNWPIFVNTSRGKIYSDDGKSLLVDQAAMEALEFLRDMIYVHGVWTTKAPYYTTAFADGSAGMIIAGPRYVKTYRDIAVSAWDVAMLPGRTADMPFQEKLRPGGLSLCAWSTKKQAAWRFIEFFLSYEAQLLYAQAGQIPMNRRAATSPYLLDATQPPKNMGVFLHALEVSVPNTDPIVPKTVANMLNEELTKVWNRGESVQQVIEGARNAINALLNEF